MIGIDLGGTRIKGVYINHKGEIIHSKIKDTDDDGSAGWKVGVSEIVKSLQKSSNDQFPTIGISAPGLPDLLHKSIAFMPGRLDGLENYIWENDMNCTTFVLNDAVAALVAEARFGSAKDMQNVVMLTLGTGVGGAILINGHPYGGAFNKAGHLGHMSVDWKGEMDVTNMPGSIEMAIGNYNVCERTQGFYSSTYDLVQAYKEGNKRAADFWLLSVEKLAVGLASIANVLSPEVVVIGGGIAESDESLFEPLNHYMSKYEWRPGSVSTPIVKAQCGEWAGAIGAAVFANEKSNNS